MKNREPLGLRLIYALALGLVMGITWPAMIYPGDMLAGVRVVGLVLLVTFISIASHEMGHWLAFKGSGFGLAMLAIGPLNFSRRGGRFRLAFRPILGASGLTLSYPRGPENLRRAVLVGIAGGPAAGVMTALVAALIYVLRSEPNLRLDAGLVFLGGYSLLTSLWNLVPFQVGAFTTDGFKLRSLWRMDPAGYSILVEYRLQGAILTGTRPRQWDSADLNSPLEPSAPASVRLRSLLRAYLAALDRGEIEAAGEWIDQAERLLPDVSLPERPPVLVESAYFHARYRSDPRLARERLAKVHMVQLFEPQTYRRAEAAVLLAEENYGPAFAKAKDGLRLAARALETGTAVAEIEWLKEIEAQAAQAMAAGAAPEAHKPSRVVFLEPAARPPKPSRPIIDRLHGLLGRTGRSLAGVTPLFGMIAVLFGSIWVQAPAACQPRLLGNFACQAQVAFAMRMGRASYSNGEYQRARTWFERAAKKNPYESLAYSSMASSSLMAGDYPQASKDYEQAISTDWYNPDLHYNLGLVLLALNDQPAAVERLVTALALEPNPQVQADYLPVLETALKTLPDPQAFSQGYHDQISANPYDPDPYCMLGLVYRYTGQADLSAQTLEAGEAIDEWGDYGWCWER